MLQVSSSIQVLACSVDVARLKQRYCSFQTGVLHNNSLLKQQSVFSDDNFLKATHGNKAQEICHAMQAA